MSLSFSVTSKVLSSIGYGLSDIAVLTGAGRNVISWLSARYKDQALLEFLVKDQKEIIPRRGLISTADLDRRWSQRLNLFQDGHILPFEGAAAVNILHRASLDLFTWFMTLLVAALSAATSLTCTRSVIAEFLLRRCADSDGIDSLRYDVGRHIDGWTSIATTRGILRVARDTWDRLGRHGLHPPGFMPDSDAEELIHMIEWLVDTEGKAENNRLFYTASSDIYSLAALLNEIGITSLQCSIAKDGIAFPEPLESQILLILDESRLLNRLKRPDSIRGGMRVNLSIPEECVSSWPGDEADNNRRRTVFLSAANAAAAVQFTAGQSTELDSRDIQTVKPILVWKYCPPKRTKYVVNRFCEEFLIAPSADAAAAVAKLFDSWPSSLRSIEDQLKLRCLNQEKLPRPVVSDIQVFLLGYYYGLLAPLVDTTHLLYPEAFGSWTWNNFEILDIVGPLTNYGIAVKHGSSQYSLHYLERQFILGLIAYFFAGAGPDQVKTAWSSNENACGIHGKLSILDSGLMGDADSISKLCKFVLLDVDRTCFPSNEQGVMIAGVPTSCATPVSIPQDELDLKTLSELQDLSASRHQLADYSSLVEPYWNVDPNQVLVAFRRHGRIVGRFGLGELYHAIFTRAILSDTPTSENPELVDHHDEFRFALFAWTPAHLPFSDTRHEIPQRLREEAANAALNCADESPSTTISTASRPGRPRELDNPPKLHLVDLSIFDGGHWPRHADRAQDTGFYAPLYVRTGGCRKIRSCVTTLCANEKDPYVSEIPQRDLWIPNAAIVIYSRDGKHQIIIE